MRNMINTCVVLVLVGTCAALPQQQGEQFSVTSQCGLNQDCVPYYQCKDGYINTDGEGLIDTRAKLPKGTCSNPDLPGVPAICCNIPKIPEPQPKCASDHKCVPYYQCKDGYINTDGEGLIDTRAKLPKGSCIEPDYPGVPAICCKNHEIPEPPTTPKPLATCPGNKVCVSLNHCDTTGNVVTDGFGGFKQCYVDQSSEVGICCTPSTTKCGVKHSKSIIDERIPFNIASKEAQFGEFPWQAIIFFRNYTFKCGASLIGDKWVLTAAHCVNGFTSNDFKIRLGEWQINSLDDFKPYFEVDVAAISIHPKFNPKNVHNDIAVLQLSEPIDFQYHINPICLPSPGQTFWGQRCITTGWDKYAFEGQSKHIMKKVELPTVEHIQCQILLRNTRLGKYFILDKSFICAGGEENNDACNSDNRSPLAGSPLACQDQITGQYVLTGITAFGIGCDNKDVPKIYADVQALLPFIETVVI